MDISHPINSLIPSLAGPVLEVLAGTTRPLSGREVTSLLSREASQPGVQRVLDELAADGLVTQERRGNAVLNTLNRRHLLAPLVAEAASAYRTFIGGIADLVRTLDPQPSRALLFGSTARRDAGPESDVDIALVWGAEAPGEGISLAEAVLRQHVEEVSGNQCQLVSYLEAEFDELPQTSPEFADRLQGDSIDLLSWSS